LIVAVVEDDAPSRQALGRLLRAEGFETVLFPSAEAFMDARPVPAPLCVIVDVNLPGISGIELQQRLLSETTALPVIVTTGARENVIRERAERNGCAGFFWKPFDGAALLETIASLAKR
jgi:FixJ family two-component response regulator